MSFDQVKRAETPLGDDGFAHARQQSHISSGNGKSFGQPETSRVGLCPGVRCGSKCHRTAPVQVLRASVDRFIANG